MRELGMSTGILETSKWHLQRKTKGWIGWNLARLNNRRCEHPPCTTPVLEISLLQCPRREAAKGRTWFLCLAHIFPFFVGY